MTAFHLLLPLATAFHLLLLLAPAAGIIATTAATTKPAVWWCSWAAPGRTLLLGSSAVPASTDVTLTALTGGGVGESATVSATPASDGDAEAAAAVSNSGSGLTVLVPSTLRLAAYRVQVVGAAPFVCGAPDVWWVQGSAGNASVAGGWLRAFGRHLALLPAGSARSERSASTEAVQLAAQAGRAARRGDWVQTAELASQIAALSQISAAAHAAAAINTTVKLCKGTQCTLLHADGATTPWHAQFWIPADMVPGDYEASVSNGFSDAKLDMFIGPDEQHAHVSTVSVLPATGRRPWPTKVFDVSKYGCMGGWFQGEMAPGWNKMMDTSQQKSLKMNCSYEGLPYNCPRDCSSAIKSAIAAAGDHPGGGVVLVPRGRWYVRAPLLLPDNVVLKGEGATQTAVLFAFENKSSAPKHMIAASSGTAHGVRFAVEDMTFWHTTYYQTFVDVSSNTDGVRIRNVNIRANMFTWAWNTDGTAGAAADGGVGPRQPPWDLSSNMHSHELISIHSKNFEISGCDLWATADLFGSGSATSDGYGGGFATWGLIANNTGRSGGSCHWLDGVQQLIFENNTCDGASLTAEGSNLDTYGCAMQQHAYMHANKVTNTWGYDREAMTYDGDDRRGQNVGGAPTAISADGLNITVLCMPGRNAPTGGAAVIFSGAGAGQIRRVVATSSDGVHCSFKLDQQFAGTVDASSVFEFMPFRGENIFHNQEYQDTGVFQFYGFSHKAVVAGSVHSRTEGVMGWGMSSPTCEDGHGIDCNTTAPNFQSEFIGITFLDGIHAGHQSGQGGTNQSCRNTSGHQQIDGTTQCADLAGGFGDGIQLGGDNLGLMWSPQASGALVNRLVVFRENLAVSHGGISIGAGTDILLEDNDVASAALPNADPAGPLSATTTRTDGILVQNSTHGVVLRNNKPADTVRLL